MGQNLQRLLMAPQMAPHQDFPHQSADQASFTANLLQIQSQEKIGDRRVNVTSSIPPEVIHKKEQELGSLSRKKSSDQCYFEEHSKVQQARSKEMSLGKEQTIIPRLFATKTDQLTATFSAEKTCGAPKVQVTTTKPLPSIFMSSNPASIMHSTNGEIIESQVHVKCHWPTPVHASLSLGQRVASSST